MHTFSNGEPLILRHEWEYHRSQLSYKFWYFHPFKLLTTLLIMVTKIWYMKNYLFYLNSWIFKYRSIMGRARPFRHNTNEPEMHYFSINGPLLKGKFWNEKLTGVITNKSYMNQWKAILANYPWVQDINEINAYLIIIMKLWL